MITLRKGRIYQRSKGEKSHPPEVSRKEKKMKNKDSSIRAKDLRLQGLCLFDLQEDVNKEEKEDTTKSNVEECGNVILPSGTMLIDILDVGFAPEDIGNILQFLEFCKTFGDVYLYVDSLNYNYNNC